MASDKVMSRLNGATKWIVIATAALITIGGMIQTLYSHTERFNKVEPEVQLNTEHRIKFEEKILSINQKIDEIDNSQKQMLIIQRELLREIKNRN